MGKYMRKSKSEVAVNVMDNLSAQKSALGVRTRAKTLALQRQRGGPATPAAAAAANSSSSGYLQLRSRRLLRLKPPIFKEPRRISPSPELLQEHRVCQNPNFSPNSDRIMVETPNSGDKAASASASGCKDNVDDVDGFCGENVVDSDSRERSTRESTPSNMIRDPDAINTPGSTTRPTSSIGANRRLQNSMQRHIPTSREMEEFFADAEEQQQREFVDKYNFDPANENPLPGRYEWERVKP